MNSAIREECVYQLSFSVLMHLLPEPFQGINIPSVLLADEMDMAYDYHTE